LLSQLTSKHLSPDVWVNTHTSSSDNIVTYHARDSVSNGPLVLRLCLPVLSKRKDILSRLANWSLELYQAVSLPT